MQNLDTTHPDVCALFMNGYHVLRRSDRYWAGLSSDLVIEQELMRSVKTTGGLTRGRGMGEVQRAQWLLSMPACADMNNAMQALTGTGYQTSDQHKETSTARQERDCRDINTILAVLKERNPFSDDPALRNLETGETAEDAVNQDSAREVGKAIIDEMSGRNILEHNFKRSKQVVTLGTKTSVKVDGDRIEVDPQLLFQRLTVASGHMYDDPADLFKYELCGFPSSLFDSSGFPRQAQKPALADAIWNMGNCGAESIPSDIISVIDGGSLLQKIPWAPGASFASICSSYVEYVSKKYDKPTIVFDGYLNGTSIKDVTHTRRNRGKYSRRIADFAQNMLCRTKKEAFLSNPENKQSFINLLSTKLEDRGFVTVHAEDDADLSIVQTAISCARMQPVEVIGEDTDLLVLLCFHANSSSSKIYFRSDINRTSGKEMKIWDINSTKRTLGEGTCNSLLALHAITGCDSTSRLFGIGKGPAFKKLQQSQYLISQAAVFMSTEASRSEIVHAGEKIMVALYGGNSDESLDVLRYRKFASKVRTGTKCIEVSTLPPTSDAAYFHSLRAYLQCQSWKGDITLWIHQIGDGF